MLSYACESLAHAYAWELASPISSCHYWVSHRLHPMEHLPVKWLSYMNVSECLHGITSLLLSPVVRWGDWGLPTYLTCKHALSLDRKCRDEKPCLFDSQVHPVLTTYTDFPKTPLRETDGKSGWRHHRKERGRTEGNCYVWLVFFFFLFFFFLSLKQ